MPDTNKPQPKPLPKTGVEHANGKSLPRIPRDIAPRRPGQPGYETR